MQSRTWPKGARAEDLGRYVAYEYAELFRATDAEKRVHLPASLPQPTLKPNSHWTHWPQAGSL